MCQAKHTHTLSPQARTHEGGRSGGRARWGTSSGGLGGLGGPYRDRLPVFPALGLLS